MSGNISHFKKFQMNDPITELMVETEDNNDSMSLSCELMTTYPGHSHDTYIVAATLSVVSAKCKEQPDDLIGMLSARPGHLSVTTSQPSSLSCRINYLSALHPFFCLKIAYLSRCSSFA